VIGLINFEFLRTKNYFKKEIIFKNLFYSKLELLKIVCVYLNKFLKKKLFSKEIFFLFTNLKRQIETLNESLNIYKKPFLIFS
jgi:hypothetical protein